MKRRFRLWKHIRSLLRKVWELISGVSASPIDREIEIPRGLSTTEFYKLHRTRTPLVGGDVQIRHLFDNPHPAVAGMQRRVAATLFELIEAPYLPGRLLDLLKLHDAFEATSAYLDACGLRYDHLLASATERAFFQEVMGVLADADATRRRWVLDDEPLYEAIRKRDLDLLERHVERLHLAARIAPYVFEKHRVVFPAFYADFRDRAAEMVRKWATLTNSEIAEIEETYRIWIRLQYDYDDTLREITALVAALERRVGKRGTWRRALRGIVKDVEKCQRDVEAGRLEPGEGIDRLRFLAEDLRRLMAEAPPEPEAEREEGERSRGPKPPPASDLDRLPLSSAAQSAHLDSMELPSHERHTRTALKYQHRRLAIKYHPDLHPDAPEAGERFRTMQQAYERLCDHMDYTGHDYIHVHIDVRV